MPRVCGVQSRVCGQEDLQRGAQDCRPSNPLHRIERPFHRQFFILLSRRKRVRIQIAGFNQLRTGLILVACHAAQRFP